MLERFEGIQWLSLLWLMVPLGLFLLSGLTSRHRLRIVSSCAQALFLTGATLNVLAIILIAAGQGPMTIGPWLRLDGLTAWMGLLVVFLGWVNLRYSRRYLAGDQAGIPFQRWFLATIGSVLILVSTGHLLLLAGSWLLISLTLHPLLCLYPRRGAKEAAWQKFLVSRLGDLALFVGVIWLHQRFGSWELAVITEAVSAGHAPSVTAPAVAFALAAVLKCAQIPFHGWLVRVMEAPTPVSALLHAGIINLGGFLWLRMVPVFESSMVGHAVLLGFGAVTAAMAGLIIITQSSIKHSLAWSTNAQMGFMLLELGLGAYTLALLHLIAHSLYKAHAFLSTGRIVVSSRVGDLKQPVASPGLLPAGVVAIIVPVAAMTAGHFGWFSPVPGLVFMMAMAYVLIFSVPALPRRSRTTVAALVVLLPMAHGLGQAVLSPSVPVAETPFGPWHGAVTGVMVLGAAVYWFVLTSIIRRSDLAIWQPLLAHSRNAFYLSVPLDRLIQMVRQWLLSGPHREPRNDGRFSGVERKPRGAET
ncbi:hypothetical protein CF392_11160 [Tamilnaduibacter salinus]|uniref:Probable inorganic carbon transporter subunit DabB n=1 Tax=Tamilnaduibacter salinus TaxID=1484056 RepID=A0A2A2I163_9GAMM|nr:proton-conducting transporter membrane subunit [Tamilnaduibacter salinus]PAV25387.1 hypothetical protein CF392_11160 [Tamilnaduibacter salinus]